MKESQSELAKFGKGIGNQARFGIVEALLEGPKSVSQLTEIVGLSQSSVSQHLSKLKECRLVKDERHGQEVLYTFNSWHVIGMLTSLIYKIKKSRTTRTITK